MKYLLSIILLTAALLMVNSISSTDRAAESPVMLTENVKKPDFNKTWDIVSRLEGGYQDIPSDLGNYNSDGKVAGTNHGITPIAVMQHSGIIADSQYMASLSRHSAAEIAQKLFWDPIHGDEFSDMGMALIFFDCFFAEGYTGLISAQRSALRVIGSGIRPDEFLTMDEVLTINCYPMPGIIKAQITRRRLADAMLKNSRFFPSWSNRIKAIYNEAK